MSKQLGFILVIFYIFPIIFSKVLLKSSEEMTNITPQEMDIFASKFHIIEDSTAQTSNSPLRRLSSKFLSEQKLPMGGNCEHRTDYQIPQLFLGFPAYKGKLQHVGDTLTFVNHCFQENTFTLINQSESSITVSITAANAISYFCNDIYLFFTSSIHQVKIIYFRGSSEVTISSLTPEQIMEINSNGIRIFAFCDDVLKSLASLYKTFDFILTNPAPEKGLTEEQYGRTKFIFTLLPHNWKEVNFEEIEKEHIDFLKTYAHIDVKRRYGYEDKVLPVKDYIKSGDFFGLNEIASGESCLIQYGCGSGASHSAIAIRDPITNELYVAEGEDRGLLIKTYDEFIQDQIDTMHGIAWFPLREEYSKKFDSAKALEWARKREGLEYGMSNFIAAPQDVLVGGAPKYLSLEHIMLFVAIMERFDPKVANYYLLDSLNVRLGTNLTSLRELTEEISRRNKTIEDIIIMPELEEYVYPDGENWICSAFVVGIMKAGGIFGDLKIEPHEFTPRDIYQLDIYDKDFKLHGPKECLEADPDLDYCMILGKYDIRVKGYSSIPLYDHMNERCSTQAPDYFREEGC